MLATLDLESPAISEALERLAREDVLGQIIDRRGAVAALATEAGDVKLDWSDHVAWALDHPESIQGVEDLARAIRSRFDHVIWSGMGGSIQAVHALVGLGLFDASGFSLHPLDSTDPAALNGILRKITADGDLQSALERTLMIGVSMGMTSEEPITHLQWFDGLLDSAGIAEPAAHIIVMTLPGSYLDEFAAERGARRIDIQLDGASHTPGRMSAPSTRVFLLPAALAAPHRLRQILGRCQAEGSLRPGMGEDERRRFVFRDPFVRLAAWLTQQIDEGRDMVVLDMPARWASLAPWVEQVVEESLGKGGRGLLIFHDQDLRFSHQWPDRFSILRMDEGAGTEVQGRPLGSLRLDGSGDPASKLVTCARFFSGWNLLVALVGYLQDITFAGQPAVESYKAYARRLRDAEGPLPFPTSGLAKSRSGRLELYPGSEAGAAASLADAVRGLDGEGRLGYFDLTVNAEPDGRLWEVARRSGRRFGNEVLLRPVKIRSGPRDYHSTEQSETDGPPEILSLRVVVRDPETVSAGEYTPRFLHAQALGTMSAMRDAGRPVLMALVERADAGEALEDLLEETANRLSSQPGVRPAPPVSRLRSTRGPGA